MKKNFVCEWNIGFKKEIDYYYNRDAIYGYSFHHTLEDAIRLAAQGMPAYFQHSDKITDTKIILDNNIIFSDRILHYSELGTLLGAYEHTTSDGWKYYAFRDHWKNIWPESVIYPPQIK